MSERLVIPSKSVTDMTDEEWDVYQSKCVIEGNSEDFFAVAFGETFLRGLHKEGLKNLQEYAEFHNNKNNKENNETI